MFSALWVLLAAVLFQLIICQKWVSGLVRRAAAIVFIVVMAASSSMLLVNRLNVATILLFVIALYECVNMARLIRARLQAIYLRHTTLRTAIWLGCTQLLVGLLWFGWAYQLLSSFVGWIIVSLLFVVVGLVVLLSTRRTVQKTLSPILPATVLTENNVPTLTVAIPARNETQDLEECLASVIASNYPKLEILVLDDCSQNKRTPEIIRSFAHAGVRFLQGAAPQEDWLAKNQAYQQLLDEASGELVLFCGVDVRFSPTSLRMLVASLQVKHKSMVSLIPKNVSTPSNVQPMRYAWEIALPRRLFRHPPALSTCWLASRDMLVKAGGFAAVRRFILPEKYFADISSHNDDGYSFMQANEQLDVTSVKIVSEQRATTVRVWYPRLHRRLEFVMLVAMGELFCGAGPVVVLVAALMGYVPVFATTSAGVALFMLIVTYRNIYALTYRHFGWITLFGLPIAVISDVALLHYSMIRYEFSNVIWKDRNVCIPIMHLDNQA
jgi:glycosyltransferase involved in cell wall biosynthesis